LGRERQTGKGRRRGKDSFAKRVLRVVKTKGREGNTHKFRTGAASEEPTGKRKVQFDRLDFALSTKGKKKGDVLEGKRADH